MGRRRGRKVGDGVELRKQRYARAAQHYEITVTTDPEGKLVTAITWVKRILPVDDGCAGGFYAAMGIGVGADAAGASGGRQLCGSSWCRSQFFSVGNRSNTSLR